MEKINAANGTQPKIKVMIGVSADGIVTVGNAVAEYVSIKQGTQSIGEALRDTVMSFFGGGSEDSDSEKANKSNETEVDAAAASNNTNTTGVNSTAAEKQEPKEEIVSIPLNVSHVSSNIRPMNSQEKADCVKR